MADPKLVRDLFEKLVDANAETRDAVLNDPVLPPDVVNAVRETLAVARELPGNFMPQRTTQNPAAPHQIGPYKIHELLGAGGMGSVYKATQSEPIKRTVAIKLIQARHAGNEMLARFHAERQVLSRLDHPAIAKIFDAGQSADGQPYFVMEYVPGVPITKFCDENRISIDGRLELFAQVCNAVAHAHSKTVLHRDIKAGNVLAYMHDNKPAVKLIDFGVAKVLGGDGMIDLVNTQVGAVIGTYEYMSPEQAAGSADIDTRSDIYSLGVLLYELLVGVRPFERESLAKMMELEIRRVIREEKIPAPSTRFTALGKGSEAIAERRDERKDHLARKLRSELEWIPLKALRKERDRRYTSAAEFETDIENYLANRPLIAGPESRVYRAKKFVSRNRAGVVGASALALAMILGTVGTSVGFVRASEREREARTNEARALAVSDFLQSILGAANPAVAQGRRLLVSDVLSEAPALLDDLAARDQVAAAEAGLTLAEVYASVEDFDRSNEIAQRVIRWAGVSGASDGKQVNAHRAIELAARLVIAHNLGANGEVDQSIKQLEDLTSRCDRELGVDDPVTLDVLTSHADVLRMAGRYNESVVVSREAVGRAEAAPIGKLKPDIRWTALNNLAVAQGELGNYGESEQIFRQLAEERSEALGENHPHTIYVRASLALVLDKTGRNAEAMTMMRDGLERMTKVLGPHHESTRTTSMNLATAMARSGDLAGAKTEFVKILDEADKNLPLTDPRLGLIRQNLGFISMQEGEFASAEKYFSDAYDLYGKTIGKESPPALLTLGNLGSLYCAMGDFDRGIKLLREAIEIGDRTGNEIYDQNVGRANELANQLQNAGRIEESLIARRDVQRRADLMRASDPVNAALYGTQYPLALARQSKWEDAWPLLVAARANMIEAKVSEHPLFNNVLRALVKCAEETNRTAEKFQYESELPKPPPTTQP